MSRANNERVSVTVQILDKPFKLSCSADERAALLESATLVNEEMRKLAPSASQRLDYEKLAVVTALNLADELIKTRLNAQEPTRAALSAEVVSKAQASLRQVAELGA